LIVVIEIEQERLATDNESVLHREALLRTVKHNDHGDRAQGAEPPQKLANAALTIISVFSSRNKDKI
jgi:hypothetical protein